MPATPTLYKFTSRYRALIVQDAEEIWAQFVPASPTHGEFTTYDPAVADVLRGCEYITETTEEN